LFGGTLKVSPGDSRQTPFHKPHSTELVGFHDDLRGDDRFYNNVFAGPVDLSQYDDAKMPVWMDGNVFLRGAKPSKYESAPLVEPEFAPETQLIQEADGYYLEMKYDPAWNGRRTHKIVTTGLLGRAIIPNAPYEQPDGKPIIIDTDYFGKPRNEADPSAGPIENSDGNTIKLKVWPVAETE
jgi:alpha-N-arabinofuranosidase